jgi:hypothetical protein
VQRRQRPQLVRGRRSNRVRGSRNLPVRPSLVYYQSLELTDKQHFSLAQRMYYICCIWFEWMVHSFGLIESSRVASGLG